MPNTFLNATLNVPCARIVHGNTYTRLEINYIEIALPSPIMMGKKESSVTKATIKLA